jgi:hypothetical protein
MAAAKTFEATIALGGKIQASLGGAVRAAQSQLQRLGRAATAIGQRIGGAFGKLGGMLKSFAGQVIGLSLAFFGLQSAAAFIAKSTQEFEANAAAAAKLNAALANNPKLVKLGTAAVAKQQKGFADLASQQQEAGIYAGGMWTEAYAAMAQYGAGVKEASRLSKSMGDLLAKRSGFKAAAGDAKALGDQIGKAVSTGKLGKLGKELGITEKEAKQFSKGMKTAAERVAFLDKKIQARVGGQQAALAGTDKGRIQQAQNQINDMQSRLGEGFQKIERQWKELFVRMIPVIEPVLKKLTELASVSFDALVEFIEMTLIPTWLGFQSVVTDPKIVEAWAKLKKAFDPLGTLILGIVAGFNRIFDFDKMPKLDWVEQISKGLSSIADDLTWLSNTATQFWDALVGAFNAIINFKFPDWITQFKLPSSIADDLTSLSNTATQFWDALVGAFNAITSFKFPDWITQFKLPSFELPSLPQLKLAFADIALPALPTLPELSLKFAEIKVPDLDFSGITKGIERVGELIKEIGKLFSGWDIPAALISGLTALGEKLGIVKGQASAAAGAFASGGAAPESRGAGGEGWQHGGIVRSPTLGTVGEAGPEAVIPLARSARSLGLLGAAAGALGVGGGGINVDYKPVFNVTGTGPEIAQKLEAIVRQAHDDLLSQLEAANHEQARTAFA